MFNGGNPLEEKLQNNQPAGAVKKQSRAINQTNPLTRRGDRASQHKQAVMQACTSNKNTSTHYSQMFKSNKAPPFITLALQGVEHDVSHSRGGQLQAQKTGPGSVFPRRLFETLLDSMNHGLD